MAAMSVGGAVQASEEGRGELPADRWDAGDMGCGELVIKLRGRMLALEPGQLFELIATDPGGLEDIPAWCRLTGHNLVLVDFPSYLIRRKEG
ncbi:MAG: sulfurtransferase TusA family protein [Propionibacteriaceae bacterium]|nr:sulfurtransferase TusA family protein [Propionibacteriaceae bacterium]